MSGVLLLKATLVLSAALLGGRLFPRAPAPERHRLWTIAFSALLALPLLAFSLPSLEVPMPVPASWTGSALSTLGGGEQPARRAPSLAAKEDAGASNGTLVSASSLTVDSAAGAHATPSRSVTVLPRWPSVSSWLLAAWLAGTAAAFMMLLLSLMRASHLGRNAVSVTDAGWRIAADAFALELGLRRPVRLLLSRRVDTPMAAGLWRPVVFLPASARNWIAERRDVVLAHEMAHLAARDPLRHLVARLAVSVYWFHPLAWLAAAQATIAREQACDEAVLSLGRTRPSAYARVLLELADATPVRQLAVGALPMIERSLLETRVMAILNYAVRPASRRSLLIPGIAAVLLTLAIAALQPSANASARSLVLTPAAIDAVARTPLSRPERVASAAAESPSTGPMVAGPVQAAIGRDSACWADVLAGSSFTGSISTTEIGGRTTVHEQVGSRGVSRVIQKQFGDLRVCMVADDVGEVGRNERPSQWLGRARRVVIEARRGNTVQRLETSREGGGSERTSWRVGAAERSFDAAARQWRDRMLAVLDTTWELSMLRGQVSSLRGEISSIRGEESSLRGEISSLRGEVSSMRGHASSVRGEESSLRGEISSIRGHLSSLRGAISSEQGAISSLRADYQASESDRARARARIAEHEAAIARLQGEIKDYDADARIAEVEKRIKALDANGQVSAIEGQIKAFDLEGKVAAVEKRIGALDVNGKVAAIERQIEGLDADRRGRQLEERRESELKALESVIASIR